MAQRYWGLRYGRFVKKRGQLESAGLYGLRYADAAAARAAADADAGNDGYDDVEFRGDGEHASASTSRS